VQQWRLIFCLHSLNSTLTRQFIEYYQTQYWRFKNTRGFYERNEFHQWNAQGVSNAHFNHIHLFTFIYLHCVQMALLSGCRPRLWKHDVYIWGCPHVSNKLRRFGFFNGHTLYLSKPAFVCLSHLKSIPFLNYFTVTHNQGRNEGGKGA